MRFLNTYRRQMHLSVALYTNTREKISISIRTKNREIERKHFGKEGILGSPSCCMKIVAKRLFP